MAEYDKVKLQVEVVRNQLDTLIKDVNSLKSQKLSITVDSTGMDAINKFNASMKTLMQNASGAGGKITEIWAGVKDGAPVRTIETVNEGLGRTTEIIRTLDKETQTYSEVQTKTTTNYDTMAKAAQKAAEANQKAEQQAKAYLLQEEQAAAKKAERYDPTPMQKQIEALTGVNNASKSAAESARVFEKAWQDSSDKVSAANQRAAETAQKAFTTAQNNMPTLQKQFADLGRQIDNAVDKYPKGTFSKIAGEVASARTSLAKLDSDLAAGKISYEDYTKGVNDAKSSLRQLQSEFSQTQKDTEKLNNTTNLMGDSFVRVAAKMALWQILGNEIGKIIRSFKEAVQTMKEVDTELTAIQKVTNNTDAEMEKLSQHAYEVASQYGVAVTDYLESTGTFAKAGYKELSEDMAELATKTQLVGDVNAETANQFLLSADAAFKMKGNITELSTVLDKANVIENNYATSIEKMAEGLPIVANVASMANMSIDDLMAALGTITAVTQESGTKAATALRALILNIMGDTETELEDGVTWTKDEIESLTQVLWTYSEEAMKAAQATGTIVNPMEAVAGLAKAYKEGVLTQAELAEIESSLGGKLRTNQLDALIKNFDMYSEMLDKVKDSAGSADQEVSIMLDSWESKANILQNTWTEFISHLLDTDLIKGALDGLTRTVELLDSDIGHFILTVAGVTAAVFGVASAVAAVVKAIAALNLASLVTPLGIVGVSLGVIVAAIYAIQNAIEENKYENLVEKFHDLSEQVEQTADKLKEAKEKLDELNETPYQERGEAWRKEREELQQTIEAYEYLLDLQKDERDRAEKSAFTADVTTGVYVGTATGAYSNYKTANSDRLTKTQRDVLNKEYDSLEEAVKSVYREFSDYIGGSTREKVAELITSGDFDEAYKKMKTALEQLGVTFKEVKLSSDEFAASQAEGMGKVAQYISQAEASGTKMSKTMREEYDAYLDADEGRYQYYLGLKDLTAEQQQYVDAMDAMISAYLKFNDEQYSSLDIIAYVANSLGVTAHQAATLAASWGLIDKANIQLAGGLEKTEDGLYKVKDAATAAADGAEDAADAIGDLADVTEYDATTAAAKLTQSLFDANGKLTDHAKQALKANSAMADLAKAELTAQQEAAKANYDNLIKQIQMVGTTAAISAQQLSNMIALSGATVGADMTSAQQNEFYRTRYRQASGKSADQDPSGYNQWLSQYFTKVSTNNYQKQLEEIQSRMDQLDSYTSDYSGTSTGGGSSSDANLEAHKSKVALLKSELTLMEKQGASEEDQKNKMRQIQQALHAQAQYLRSIGGSQADINDLSAEWWEWQEKINGELKSTEDLLDELKDALQESINNEKDILDDQLDALDAELDALKKRKEAKDDELTLEEKILAVQQAQADLANAQNERTIRQFNSRTGQWEWVADQKNIKSAEEALDKAKKDLEDFKDDLEYNAAVADIEARKDAIKAQQDEFDRQYKKLTDALKEKTRGIGDILQDIWKNATPELKAIILENTEIFKQFGIDVSQLSDAVNETAQKLYGISKNGDRYEIGSENGINFVNNAKPGEVMTGGDGSKWVKNPDGTVTITDKDGISYTVNGDGSQSGNSGSTGGQKYSGTVEAFPDSGVGATYKISSATGLNFLNNEPAGATMTGGDGSKWVKNADGTTSIVDKYGNRYTVYDKGGVLRGMGGIKATSANEIVLPPDITARMLAPAADERFEKRIRELGFIYGATSNQPLTSGARFDNHSIGTQHNGNVYQLGGISISEGRARTTSVYDLAQMARTLTISNKN